MPGCSFPSMPHLCSGNRLSGQLLLLEASAHFLKSLSASPLDIPMSVSWRGVRNSFETVLAAGLNTPPLPPVKLPRRAAGPRLTLGMRCIWDPSVMKSLEKASACETPSTITQQAGTSRLSPKTCPAESRHFAFPSDTWIGAALGIAGCCPSVEKALKPFCTRGTRQVEPLDALLPPGLYNVSHDHVQSLQL